MERRSFCMQRTWYYGCDARNTWLGMDVSGPMCAVCIPAQRSLSTRCSHRRTPKARRLPVWETRTYLLFSPPPCNFLSPLLRISITHARVQRGHANQILLWRRLPRPPNTAGASPVVLPKQAPALLPLPRPPPTAAIGHPFRP